MVSTRKLMMIVMAMSLICAGVSSAESGEDTADERLPVFTDLVDVNVVNLFLYATDGASEVEFSLQLLIRDGTSRIAIAVDDELSGAVGSAVIGVSD